MILMMKSCQNEPPYSHTCMLKFLTNTGQRHKLLSWNELYDKYPEVKKKKRLWHIVPAVQQVAGAHISKLTAKCFIIRPKHFAISEVLYIQYWRQKQQSDKHQHLDCQLKGWLLVDWQIIYFTCQFTYILFTYVCIYTSNIIWRWRVIQQLIFSDRCVAELHHQYVYNNSTFSSTY